MWWLTYFGLKNVLPVEKEYKLDQVSSITSRTSQDEISVEELLDSLGNDPKYSFENEPKRIKSKINYKPETELLNFINELDSYGYNLFHRAIMVGDKNMVSEFISYNVDLYKLTKYKRNPLGLALYHKEYEIAMMIWKAMNKLH